MPGFWKFTEAEDLMRMNWIFVGTLLIAMTCRFAVGDSPSTQPDSMEAVRYFSCSDNMADQAYLNRLEERLCRKLEPDAKQILGVDPIQLRDIIDLKNEEVSGRPEILNLRIDGRHDARLIPEQFADRAAAALPGVVADLDNELLAKSREPDQEAMKNLQLQKDLTDSELGMYRAQMAELGGELIQLGIYDEEPDDLHQLVQKLDEQRELAKIDRAAVAARRDALAETIDKLSAKAQDKADSDEIVTELQKVVTAKEEMVQHDQEASSKRLVSQADLSGAQADLAEARVRLLERKEAVARAAGGDALVQFQTELQNIQVNAAESEAKDKAMDELAQSFVRAQDISNQLKEKKQARDKLADQRVALNEEIGKTHFSLESVPTPTHQVHEMDTPQNAR
jgi:hypothetical protein